MPGIIVGTHI